MTGSRWQAIGPGGLTDFRYQAYRAPAPASDEVQVQVRAAGVNPADLKHLARATEFPAPIGYEIAGVVTAVGSNAVGGSGQLRVGDRVVAFRIYGGYGTELSFPACDAFVLPDSVDDVTAAGLLLAGTTAADMLHRSGARAGETVLVHGASGAVGTVLIQLAVRAGISVIGTARPDRFDAVRHFGGVPVAYGDGLLDRVRAVDTQLDAAFDLAGTEEAISTSLDLVPDRQRIITAANKAAAQRHRVVAVAGTDPASAAFRDSVRADLIAQVAAGELEVPVARTFSLADAVAALDLVASGRAGGKVVLVA